MVFMAVEMASVPSYVLAGMLRRHQLGSEAALKYAVYGAGAAGIMLYGISLIAGLVNAVHLPTVASRLAEMLPTMGPEQLTVLGLACLMIAVGLAFKLSAVPFHFWCPDVFEGTTAEVGGFLSVASKAAALALLLRVVVGFGWIVPEGVRPGERSGNAAGVMARSEVDRDPGSVVKVSAASTEDSTSLVSLSRSHVVDSATSQLNLERARYYLSRLVALLAVITCTFGNLAAYGQTNIKRLLAYSTIAHAGYMMMAIPPLLALLGTDVQGAQYAAASLAIYISVYLFMNLGAFAIVAFLRNAMRSEEIADYAGLLRRCPGLAICFTIILLGLIGLPPLSGFLGKFVVFASLTDAFRATGEAYLMAVLVIGGINTAISLFYYLRIVRLMTMFPEPETRGPFSLPLVSLQGAYITLLTLPTAFLIVGWERLNEVIMAATQSLFV
jgi:NADH-quinone oxidoreductase subunit N